MSGATDRSETTQAVGGPTTSFDGLDTRVPSTHTETA